jgi:hypothetical protein
MDRLATARIQTVRDHMRLGCEGDRDGAIATFAVPAENSTAPARCSMARTPSAADAPCSSGRIKTGSRNSPQPGRLIHHLILRAMINIAGSTDHRTESNAH